MPLIAPRALGYALVCALPILVACTDARAAEPQCAPAYENAQLLRRHGKLLAAREQAAVCAREQCPEVARRDCARWLDELGHEIPSVVLVVRDEADRDAGGQRVTVDGAARGEVAAGRAFELDPGSHVFRLERPGTTPVERTFTIYQGERDRILRLSVPSPTPAAAVTPTPAAASPSAPAQATEPPRRERPSYVATAIVGVLSVATLGTSAYLGLSGRQDLNGLRASCAPSCSDAQVDPVRARLTASDWTLGIGLVGAAVTTYLFLHTHAARAQADGATLGVAPTRGGAVACVGARV